jgi:hypothetical protein
MTRSAITALILACPMSAFALTGGPDADDYSFFDNDEVEGPVFDFQDITALGTGLNLADDAESTVDIGFEFPFYGEVYSSVSIDSNGGIRLGAASLPFSNQCLPSSSAGGAAILVLWDDLNPSVAGDVYWAVVGTGPDQTLIVQWDNVPQYGQTNSHTFQVKLYSSGSIEMHYNNVDSGASGATIGIQSSATAALQYTCNEAGLTGGTAIRFSQCDQAVDLDDDGFSDCEDCDDQKAYVYPGAPDSCDGIDQNCDGVDGIDADGDGWSACDRDCNDFNPDIYPTAPEIFCDGIDQDCDEWTLDNPDLDEDGFFACVDDCDDEDPDVSPDGVEILCNGINDDCDALTGDDADLDGDGYMLCNEDCDDNDPLISPVAVEVTCNGVDEDCDFVTTPDAPDEDGDADSVCDGDCDDNNQRINSLRAERPCNGVDDDCNPETDDLVDNDGDGVSVCDDDCDDQAPEVYPGAEEITCNYVDDDCDDATDDDEDYDRDGISVCQDDCDDEDPNVNPSLSEVCGDDLDNNCDGEIDEGCAVEPTDTDITELVESGCGGCAQSGSPGGAGLMMLVGALGFVRRRRVA